MNINGVWYNELGSKVIIKASGQMLTGTYQSAVGGQGVFQMTGMVDPVQAAGQTFGMVVVWNNSTSDLQSTTAWCGQLQMINGQETLTTMWLLNQTTNPADNWESMLIGQDVFTRNAPPGTTAKKAMKKHPYKR
ncbi:MAG TPA: avidin/streptavidin family protein [Candidatus Udaeobacter sp.]|nr:avidin/streptavidin family protein [Candidatus Udaeobacter sp.]